MNNSCAKAIPYYNNNSSNIRDLTYIKCAKRRSRESLIIEQKEESKAIARAYAKAGFVALAIIWILAIGIVFAAAKCAEIQCDINEINEQNIILENENRVLMSKIEGAKSSYEIETSAIKLGMSYPTEKECLYLEPVSKNEKASLKEAIIERAYGN